MMEVNWLLVVMKKMSITVQNINETVPRREEEEDEGSRRENYHEG